MPCSPPAERHGSAILIAGNGHVRSDRGVPWHLRRRAPDARIVSVVLVEVEDGRMDPTGYLPRDPEGRPAADLAIFTPRAERGDPCESLRKKGVARIGGSGVDRSVRAKGLTSLLIPSLS